MAQHVRSRGGGVRGIRGLQPFSTGGVSLDSRLHHATKADGFSGRVRTLDDMSDDEISGLERQLGAPIRRPSKKT